MFHILGVSGHTSVEALYMYDSPTLQRQDYWFFRRMLATWKACAGGHRRGLSHDERRVRCTLQAYNFGKLKKVQMMRSNIVEQTEVRFESERSGDTLTGSDWLVNTSE
jgi:hypothetical protein